MSEGCSPGREAAREQSRPTKSVTKKGSPISRISFSLGVHAKAQEQSAKAILDRKSLEGSSLTGRVLHEGTASGLSSSNRGENRVPARCSAGKVNIGPGEGLNANKRSPLPDAALTPHNPTPILSLQALTAPPAKDVAPQSSRKFLAQHSPNAVSTLRAGSHVTHCKIETRQRVPDPPTHATAPRQPLNGPIPPVEVISRRREQGIISKTSKENNIHSQAGLQTAERQSLPWLADARSEGGEQLARAAAYIQERLTRCASACDEFISQKPKVPLDKKAEPDTQRHVIWETEKTRVSSCSPESLTESESISWSQIKAVPPLQPNGEVQSALLRFGTPRANEIYTESSESAQISTGLEYKTSDDGVRERRSALSIEAVKADRYSFEHLAEIKGVLEEPVTPTHMEEE